MIVFQGILIALCCISTHADTRHLQLFNKLLDSNHYHTAVKPSSNQVEVKVAFTLSRIEKLEEKTQTMVSFGYINMKWNDKLLTWTDPNVKELVIMSKYIWLPEIEIFNSVEEVTDMSQSIKGMVRINNTGDVIYSPQIRFATYCALDLSFFPFDTQICQIQLINWMHKAASVNLTLWTDQVSLPRNLFSAATNVEWVVEKTNVFRTDFVMEDPVLRQLQLDQAIPMVTVSLTLRREPLFYLMNVILPTVMITLMSMMVYVLPSESGEKVSFSITVLLSYSVMLLMVSDIMPKSGNTVPYITAYIVLSMFLTSISLFMTILILNIYHHHPYRPVPKYVKKVAFGCLSRIFCIDVHFHKTRRERKSVRRSKVEPQVFSEKLSADEESNIENGAKKAGSGRPKTMKDRRRSASLAAARQNQGGDDDEYDEKLISNKVEWEQLAIVVDRVLFFFGLLFVLGTTILFFMVVKFTAVNMADIGSTISSGFTG